MAFQLFGTFAATWGIQEESQGNPSTLISRNSPAVKRIHGWSWITKASKERIRGDHSGSAGRYLREYQSRKYEHCGACANASTHPIPRIGCRIWSVAMISVHRMDEKGEANQKMILQVLMNWVFRWRNKDEVELLKQTSPRLDVPRPSKMNVPVEVGSRKRKMDWLEA